MNINGPSLTVGVLSIVIAALIYLAGDMAWPRLMIALTMTGTAGLLNATFGPKIREVVNTADATVGTVLGRFTGVVVTGIVGIVVLGYLGFRVWKNVIDDRTITAAALAPPVVTLIPGMLGSVATTVVGIVPWAIASVFSFAFGIR